MSRQQEYRAGRVYRVAIANEDTTPPTAVNYGSSIDWDTEMDWEVNPFGFTGDDFEISTVDDDSLPVKAADEPLKRFNFRDNVPGGWDSISIPSNEVGKKIMDWATNIEQDGNVYEETASATRKAFIIEVQGLGMFYMPSVEILSSIGNLGRKSVTRTNLLIDIFATNDVPGGRQWIEFTEESP